MIDRIVLNVYADLLTDNMKSELIAALSDANQKGHVYRGPEIKIYLPTHLARTGIPQLMPTHFVGGGYLTPIGKQMAEILLQGAEANDDYRL